MAVEEGDGSASTPARHTAIRCASVWRGATRRDGSQRSLRTWRWTPRRLFPRGPTLVDADLEQCGNLPPEEADRLISEACLFLCESCSNTLALFFRMSLFLGGLRRARVTEARRKLKSETGQERCFLGLRVKQTFRSRISFFSTIVQEDAKIDNQVEQVPEPGPPKMKQRPTGSAKGKRGLTKGSTHGRHVNHEIKKLQSVARHTGPEGGICKMRL